MNPTESDEDLHHNDWNGWLDDLMADEPVSTGEGEAPPEDLESHPEDESQETDEEEGRAAKRVRIDEHAEDKTDIIKYPDAGTVIRCDKLVNPNFFAPFKSQQDWEIASWAIARGGTQGSINACAHSENTQTARDVLAEHERAPCQNRLDSQVRALA